MARVIKEYAVRRNEILDAAQRLVQTKGYEQMTIQDLLDDLQISKGAFYHYFTSKQALLEALIERMVNVIEPLVLTIVHDPHLSALEKLCRLFGTVSRWKTARKEFLLALLRVWYADDNVLIRQKTRDVSAKLLTPQLQVIIQQGLQEGTLTMVYPEQMSGVIVALLQDLGDAIGALCLAFDPKHHELSHVEQTVAAYTNALERVLGAPSGSLQLVDMETLRAWFVAPSETQRRVEAGV